MADVTPGFRLGLCCCFPKFLAIVEGRSRIATALGRQKLMDALRLRPADQPR
jgi:hypothetical protein